MITVTNTASKKIQANLARRGRDEYELMDI